MKNIKWDNGVVGILSEREKLLCDQIDTIVSSISKKGKDLFVVISIEGGNQFHIRSKEKLLIGYMSAEQCLYTLNGILVSTIYM